MLRRLRSMVAWNVHHRVHNDYVRNYYGSLSSRDYVRAEARREVDDAMNRAGLWL